VCVLRRITLKRNILYIDIHNRVGRGGKTSRFDEPKKNETERDKKMRFHYSKARINRPMLKAARMDGMATSFRTITSFRASRITGTNWGYGFNGSSDVHAAPRKKSFDRSSITATTFSGARSVQSMSFLVHSSSYVQSLTTKCFLISNEIASAEAKINA